MKMKKIIGIALSLVMALGILAGCTGSPATTGTPDPKEPQAVPDGDGGAVKTGLSLITDVAKSKSVDGDEDGQAQTNVSLVALTVDDSGVIQSCVIDAVQVKIDFDKNGALINDVSQTFPTKNELGKNYGMNAASSIGKEWSEQAEAMAEYAVGKTVQEIKSIALNESGAPEDADLAASITLSIGSFIDGIEAAVNNAQHLGAQQGDKLSLATEANMSKSKDASADDNGLGQAYVTVAALTFRGDVISSCTIDAVQGDVSFDDKGEITSDLSAQIKTKNQLGTDYGLSMVSSVGKEWNEQAKAFCEYVTGMTATEALGIAVDEKSVPQDADLKSSVTISIGNFISLVEKAA